MAIAVVVLVGFGLARLWAAELVTGSFAGYMLGALIVAAISGADDAVQVKKGRELDT
ncbi:MAG: hypothetical protein HY327_06955 [Chloroflexi bacterium]|nr:hypothetical protein [Chloroflexota bacterium]